MSSVTLISQLWRTATFRLALIYLALFGVSVAALVAFLYFSTVRVIERQTDETIIAEITGLSESYRDEGLLGLRRVVAERSRGQRHSLYLLVAPGNAILAGNLDRWPSVTAGPSGWLNFTFGQPMGRNFETHEARARHILLDDGFQLLVGRDIQQRRDIDALVREALVWALALVLLIGLAGGVVMSRNLLGRIEAINRTSQEIVAGDLGRRIPVRGSNDEIDRLAVNLNHMLDQIEHLMEARRQVTDNIAHDLRTPLARLKTRLERLRYAGVSDEADKAVEEADKLLATFAALLRIARIESGERRAAFQTVDLTGLVDDVAELYRPLMEEQGKKLVIHNAPDITVRGDRDMLFQAFANLLDNALKHTPADGRVELSLGKANSHIHIVVADDGHGIPADEREKVIGRFYRVDQSRATPGSGLGLSLVAAVVELHHGKLCLEDNAHGQGLRVVVQLHHPE